MPNQQLTSRSQSAAPSSRTFPRSPLDRRIGPAAFHRLVRLHETLAAGATVSAVQLARQLELSARTIKRDIEHLRDRHGAPILWDATARGYRYAAPFDLLTGLRLDADEKRPAVPKRSTCSPQNSSSKSSIFPKPPPSLAQSPCWSTASRSLAESRIR